MALVVEQGSGTDPAVIPRYAPQRQQAAQSHESLNAPIQLCNRVIPISLAVSFFMHWRGL